MFLITCDFDCSPLVVTSVQRNVFYMADLACCSLFLMFLPIINTLQMKLSQQLLEECIGQNSHTKRVLAVFTDDSKCFLAFRIFVNNDLVLSVDVNTDTQPLSSESLCIEFKQLSENLN